MPFIKGRFHINPIAGQALEAAREAEAALLALEHAAQQERQGDSYVAGDGEANASNEGPIHRVEIEASELVPSHETGLPGRRLGEPGRSVRAVRGYVARVHRHPVAPGQPGSSARSDMPARHGSSAQREMFAQGDNNGEDNGEADSWPRGGAFGSRHAYGTSRSGSNNASPETHVFADHRDLVSFLRDELAKDCK